MSTRNTVYVAYNRAHTDSSCEARNQRPVCRTQEHVQNIPEGEECAQAAGCACRHRSHSVHIATLVTLLATLVSQLSRSRSITRKNMCMHMPMAMLMAIYMM